MIAFFVFCVSALLVSLSVRLKPWSERRLSGLRLEGVVFVGAVLLSSLCGLAMNRFHSDADVNSYAQVARPFGALLLLLTGVVYVSCAWRGRSRLPAWLADVFVLLAACAAIYLLALHLPSGTPVQRSISMPRIPFTDRYVRLGFWAAPLAVFWMWAVARMMAALNRTPQVTGGYLGLVAGTLLLLGHFSRNPQMAFSPIASAALAGAGLASVPLAMRKTNYNIGWPGALAMGFLVAQIAVVGLSKNMTFAILALLALAFGLPLLDVSFYKLRAARRGEKVEWEKNQLRLHQALLNRGIAPAKVALLYLSIATYLCGAGVFLMALHDLPVAVRIIMLCAQMFVGFIIFFSITRVLMRRTEGEEIPDDVEAFGVRISPVSMGGAMDKIEGFIQSRTPHHVVTSDANAILRAQEDEEYAGILRRAALITPDGYGVMWGARLLNLPIYERVTGVDMVTGICERAAKKGYSIYILGSAPGIASTAAQKLSARYPGLKVAGTQHGFFKPEEEAQVIQQIRDAKPDVLFVAFGIPKQEKFIAQHFHEMNVPVSLGVGGSFDVYSEKLKRAPEYIQRAGMEWMYRVWQEPWRWRRMSYVPRFMVFALREWLFGPTTEQRARRDSNPVA